ncbi:MAG: heavy metal-binding domain-containing protein, partial [Ferruginibacter sp.]
MLENKTSSQNTVDTTDVKYSCPMHCEGDKVYDKPGKCPVCGMNLVAMQEEGNNVQEYHHHEKHLSSTATVGKYYCPMHCEGDKVYDKTGDCPVCGMHLVKDPTATSEASAKSQYTCPMHPQIIRDAPGSCPICGMDLVPMQPAEDNEDKTYKELLKKFKIAVLFTVPIFLIAMSDMLPNNALMKLFRQQTWNWIQFALSLPVVFYATWMFFKRTWTSIVTWNLNMFTLIGIGSGVAFLFSVVAMLFPNIFP